MKKAMLRLVLAGLALAAAAGAARAADPVEVTLWYSYRGQEQSALKQVIDAFHQSRPDIRVKLLQVPHDAFADKISAAIPRGQGPDLFIFAQDRIGDWAEPGIIQPVGFWATPEIRQRFLPQTLAAVTYKEDLYALPLAVKCTALYYNKALVPQPPATTSELVAAARRATQAERGSFGLVYENGLLYYQAAWLFGFGGGLFAPDGRLMLNAPANVRALEFAAGLRRVHAVMPDEISNTVVTALFNEGRAGMVVSGPWFRGEIQPGIDYGVALLPRIDEPEIETAPARPFLSVEGVLMSGRSAQPQAAFAVMDYLTSAPAAALRARVGKQPVATAAAYEDPEVPADPVIATFRRQAELAVPMPNTPEMRMVWTPMDRAIGRVLNGSAGAAAALAEAHEIVQADLDRFHGK